MSDAEEGFGYDMVMPFLPVQSKGGPYEDGAFVAGYQMGLLDAQLSGRSFDQGQAIYVENREQADLLAMRYGYTAEFTDEEVQGWVGMNIRKASADV